MAKALARSEGFVGTNSRSPDMWHADSERLKNKKKTSKKNHVDFHWCKRDNILYSLYNSVRNLYLNAAERAVRHNTCASESSLQSFPAKGSQGAGDGFVHYIMASSGDDNEQIISQTPSPTVDAYTITKSAF